MDRIRAMRIEAMDRREAVLRPAAESKTSELVILPVAETEVSPQPGIMEAFTSFVKSKAATIGIGASGSLNSDRVKKYFLQNAFPLIANKLPSLTETDIAEYNQIIDANRDASIQEIYEATKHIIEKVEIPIFEKISLPLAKIFELFVSPEEDITKTDGEIDALIQQLPKLDIVGPKSLERTTIDLEGKKLSNHLSMRFIYNVAATFLKGKMTDSFEDIQARAPSANIEDDLSNFILRLKESIKEVSYFGDFFLKPILCVIIDGLRDIIYKFTNKAINIATVKTNKAALDRLSSNTAIIGQLTHCLAQVKNVKSGRYLPPGGRCINIVEAGKECLRGDRAQLKKEYKSLTTRIIDDIDSLYKPLSNTKFIKKIQEWRSILARKIRDADPNTPFDHIANATFNVFFTLATAFVDFLDMIQNFIAKKILIVICNHHGTLEVLAEKIEETLCDQEIIDPLMFELLGEINKACIKSSKKMRSEISDVTTKPLMLTKEEQEVKTLLNTFLQAADNSENSLEKVLKKALGTHLSESAYDAILKLLSREVRLISTEITTPSKIKSYLTKILSGVNTSLSNNEPVDGSVMHNKIDAQLNDLATNLLDLGVSAATAAYSLPTEQEKSDLRTNELNSALTRFKTLHTNLSDDLSNSSLEEINAYLRELNSLQKEISDTNAKFPTSLSHCNKITEEFLTSLHEQIKLLQAYYIERCANNISASEKAAIQVKTAQMLAFDVDDISIGALLHLSDNLVLINKPVCGGCISLFKQWKIISEKTKSNLKAIVLNDCIDKESTNSTTESMLDKLGMKNDYATLALEIEKEFNTYKKKNLDKKIQDKEKFAAQIERFKRSISKAQDFAKNTDDFLDIATPSQVLESKDQGIDGVLSDITKALDKAITATGGESEIDKAANDGDGGRISPAGSEGSVIEDVARSAFAKKVIHTASGTINPQFRVTVRNLLKFIRDPLFVTNLVRGIIVPGFDPKISA